MTLRLRSRLTQVLALTAAFSFVTSPSVGQSQSADLPMTDVEINDKIDDELMYDPGVISTKINVKTIDGIATLTGEVNNILAKERATRVAETIRGVRSVVNQIKVKPMSDRTDAQIRRDVESALLENPATEAYEIVTVVENGEAALSGTVDSYQERDLVKTVAKGVRGVRSIKDQISVVYKRERPDSEVRSEIAEALRWNAYVDHQLIDVKVDDGTVTLTGSVGSAAEKRLAEADAWVAGVSSVDSSKLAVEKWARDDQMRGDKFVVKSESELEAAVSDGLAFDPRVNSLNVDVDILGSSVTLRGFVDNLQAKSAAEETAKNTVGISSVVNRLKVRPVSPFDDTEIEEDIRAALLRDPYVERFDITTTVLDGTAHLYGTVDSYFEKSHATDVASRVFGVLEVENHLEVDDDTVYIYDPYVDTTLIDDQAMSDYERRAPFKSDMQILESINDELWWSPFVDADEVTVTVDEGIATLTGTVDTVGERQSATENAYEGGATLVDNDLKLRDE